MELGMFSWEKIKLQGDIIVAFWYLREAYVKREKVTFDLGR